MAITTLADSEIRSDGFSHEQKLILLQTFRKTGNLSQAFDVCGIARKTFYLHLEHDPWLAELYEAEKERIAWNQTPNLVTQSKKGNIGAAIWLQKVFGGPQFNPDRHAVQVNVGLGFQLRDTTTSSRPSTEKG